MMGLKQLSAAIIELSNSDNWEDAKTEWMPYDIKYGDETCLCGHKPITELCLIKNTINNTITTVGNCCVNRFMGIDTNKIFISVNKVRNDITKSLTADFISLVHSRNKISDWEMSFYINTWRKRKLSVKQLLMRCKINLKILSNIKSGGKPFIDDEQKMIYQHAIDTLVSLLKDGINHYDGLKNLLDTKTPDTENLWEIDI